MLLVKTVARASDIHGLGCFAAEDIKKDQLIWRRDPRIDVEFRETDLKDLPGAVVDFLHMHCYTHVDRAGVRTMILCADHARHMNHSLTPNVLEAGEDNEFNIAARDIKAGEELTCDYAEFDGDSLKKLGK